jgi:hypothetical protein
MEVKKIRGEAAPHFQWISLWTILFSRPFIPISKAEGPICLFLKHSNREASGHNIL